MPKQHRNRDFEETSRERINEIRRIVVIKVRKLELLKRVASLSFHAIFCPGRQRNEHSAKKLKNRQLVKEGSVDSIACCDSEF